jgi:hypothetical protein
MTPDALRVAIPPGPKHKPSQHPVLSTAQRVGYEQVAGVRMSPTVRPLSLILFALTACNGPSTDDKGDTDPTDTDAQDTDATADAWDTITQDLPGALLSVTGQSASDVWTVGADGGDGPGVLHFDGAAWTQIDTQTSGDLWWVWESSPTSVWIVGEGGRVLHGDTSGFVETVTNPSVTLFGVWGASDDDVWAVGGDINQGRDAAALFHYDGEAWTPVDLPAAAAAKIAMYKLWGTASDDVWACGMGGVLVHFDGDAWTAVDSGTDRDLFTVSGTGTDDVYAVGGVGNGQIQHWSGGRWADETPAFSPDFNGVSARGAQVAVVGRTGSVWARKADGTWMEDPRGRATDKDLHATWIDPDGGVWTVGGQLSANPPIFGTLIYGGSAVIPHHIP